MNSTMDERNSTENATDSIPRSTYVQTLWLGHLGILLQGLMALATLISSLMLLSAIIAIARCRTRTNILVASHAAGGIVMSIVWMPASMVQTRLLTYWPLHPFLCTAFLTVKNLAVMLSTYWLFVMAIHRFQAVFLPQIYHRISLSTMMVRVALTWMLPFLIAFTRVLSAEGKELTGYHYRRVDFPIDKLPRCILTQGLPKALTTVIVSYVIPVVSIVSVAVLTERKVRSNRRRTEPVTGSLLFTTKPARPLILLNVLHVFSHLPLNILIIADRFVGYQVPFVVLVALRWLSTSFYLIVPVVLFAMNKGLARVLMIRLFGRCMRHPQRPVVATVSARLHRPSLDSFTPSYLLSSPNRPSSLIKLEMDSSSGHFSLSPCSTPYSRSGPVHGFDSISSRRHRCKRAKSPSGCLLLGVRFFARDAR